MSPERRPPAVCLMGPTASGKTGVAVRLAERWPMDIVSVDSALVYRGMDIGTAKPDADTLRRAPHRLIDLIEPDEVYSAAQFRDDALREMDEIAARGRIPLLVGGTMLYFRALLRGISPLPPADPVVRAAIEARAARLGWAALHDELAARDPKAARRIHPNDPQRIQRALEVIEITGRPLSAAHDEDPGEALPFRVFRAVLNPEPRRVLHERIARRFDLMLEAGFENEMRRLFEDPRLGPDTPSMRSVGYRQGWAWLAGEYGADSFREKALAATRQLAKRQLTWLRSEEGAVWYDPVSDQGVERLVKDIGAFLE